MGVSRDTRVLNLIVGLADSNRPLTAADIQERVPGYDKGNDQAVKKRLQRDRADLRESGINIIQVRLPDGGSEPGYVLHVDPPPTSPVQLEPAEYQAVSIAADMWRGTSLHNHAQCGLAKLAAQRTPQNTPATRQTDQLAIDLSTAPPTLGAIAAAVTNRTNIRFSYRAPGKKPATRNLQPHQVVWQHSAWYVAGYDTDRKADRTFKLLRIAGNVKALPTLGPFPEPDSPTRVNIPTDSTADDDLNQPIRTTWACQPKAARRLKEIAHHPANATSITLTCDSTQAAQQLVIDLGHEATLIGPDELVTWLHQQLDLVTLNTRCQAHDSTKHPTHLAESPAPTEPPHLAESQVEALLKPLHTSRRESHTGPARIIRALSLATYLQDNDAITLDELATHFQVPVKTTTADLQLIRECSSYPHTPDVTVDAHWDYGPVHLTNADALHQHIKLTEAETQALTTGLKLLGAIDTLADPARTAAIKLAGGESPAAHTTGRDTDRTQNGLTHAPVIDDAIYADRQLLVTYTSSTDTTNRKVDPWQRKHQNGAWYLLAWCHDRQEPRNFKLDRIQSARTLDARRKTQQPQTSRHSTTSQQDYALISLPPNLLPVVEKHGAVTVSDNSPIRDHILVGIGYFTHAWLARLVLSHAGSLHIIGPETARDAVSEIFQKYRSVMNSRVQ